MNAKLTQYDLQAIKERAESATEGPWIYEGERVTSENGRGVFSVLNERYIYGNDHDIRFIEAARQDIPKLLAEIERLQAEVHEHSAHNGQLIATHVIPTKEENKRLQAEVERLQAQLDYILDTVLENNDELSKAYIIANEIVEEALK